MKWTYESNSCSEKYDYTTDMNQDAQVDAGNERRWKEVKKELE